MVIPSGRDECKRSGTTHLQVFKITLEYWNLLVPDIYSSSSTLDTTAAFAFEGAVDPPNRKGVYLDVLSRLRLLMISRMAKPEEVRLLEFLRGCREGGGGGGGEGL